MRRVIVRALERCDVVVQVVPMKRIGLAVSIRASAVTQRRQPPFTPPRGRDAQPRPTPGLSEFLPPGTNRQVGRRVRPTHGSRKCSYSLAAPAHLLLPILCTYRAKLIRPVQHGLRVGAHNGRQTVQLHGRLSWFSGQHVGKGDITARIAGHPSPGLARPPIRSKRYRHRA